MRPNGQIFVASSRHFAELQILRCVTLWLVTLVHLLISLGTFVNGFAMTNFVYANRVIQKGATAA